MDREKLVYIGHEYHNKTLSTKFLIDLFKQSYDVDIFQYSMEHREFIGEKETNEEHYKVLVLFQMPVSIKELKAKFDFEVGSYFPMYDGTGEASDDFWRGYSGFNIINFSSTLHNRLMKMGLSSYYIQYFPKPFTDFEWGKEDSLFFWHRRAGLNINKLSPLVSQIDIKNIHIHNAYDPGENKIIPDEKVKNKYCISVSEWYASKKEMLDVIAESACYMAPREYEGIGMSFLEAMAMGRCVIAVNHPTMNEYIVNNQNGLLYNLNDIDDVSWKKINIKEIQKNAYDYICEGYAKWEENKIDILKWILAEPATAKNSTVIIQEKKNSIIRKIIKKIVKRSFKV